MALRQFKGSATKSVPAVNLTKKNPKLAAAISKMVVSPHGQSRDADGNRRTQLTSTFAFRNILQKRAKRNSDAAQILRLLPDIELSAQILVSSILSPKDMTSVELIYMGPKDLLSPELSAAMIGRTKQHFEEDYKIKPLLNEMVREPLFEKGAYPIAVIPENAIDEFINGDKQITLEGLSDFVNKDGLVRNTGILGPHVKTSSLRRPGVALEGHFHHMNRDAADKIDRRVHYRDEDITEYKDYVAEEFLVVIDNPIALKIPKLNARTKQAAVRKQLANANIGGGAAMALEGISSFNSHKAADGQVSDTRVEKSIFRTRQYANDPIASLKRGHELKRKSVGAPLIMKLPSESVIPLHVPGNPKQHLGCFIVLDEEGMPVEVPDGDESYAGLGAGSSNAGNSLASNIIRKVETNMGGNSQFDANSQAHLEFATQVYADMVERDLIARVKNGVYAQGASVARNEEVYRIMLSRVLARKYTQLLYLPEEYITYIAFEYTDDGVGRSLLDKISMVNTVRATMLFSDVMASVKNSIGRTKVSATLPENDPNPMKTIERVQDEIVRSRMLGIPLGVSNLTDIFDFIQRAGYEWEFNGHSGLPDLKFDFQQTQTSYAKPDTDLQESLRKAGIMSFGLSPEMVDNAFNTEFASVAAHNNILLSKRVILTQDAFTPQLSAHLRKVALNTEHLVNDLREILEQGVDGIKIELEDVSETTGEKVDADLKKKVLVQRALAEFLGGFYAELPRPSSVTLENQLQDLDTYMGGLDKALDAYISDDFLTASTAGDLANEAGTIRAGVKAYFVRKWLADKGVMSELSDLVTNDEEGKPMMNLMASVTDHVKALLRSGITSLANLKPMVAAANKDLEALNVEPSEAGSTSDSSSGGDDFGFGGGDDFGLGGDDPLADLDDDLSGVDDDLTIPSADEADAAEKAATPAADDTTPPEEPVV